MKIIGAYLGRFNPIHTAHEQVIGDMIKEFGVKNSLVLIGSANAPISLRHFFSYEERRSFIKTIFPELKVVSLPDFGNDQEWLLALDDIIRLSGATQTIFFGGCKEDVSTLIDGGKECRIFNRFDGTTPKISATEIRDCLIYGRSLDGLVNPQIADTIQKLFAQKWERFKKI
ncbi:MAG: hypothetical protein WCO55_02715 [Candidatus Falkowbacteria bacterium]